MLRESVELALRELCEDVRIMAQMTEEAIERSITALKERDIALAEEVIANDKLLNAKRFEIEEKCIKFIATQQPMAGDLRLIIAILNIIVDLERIADHAEGIAKIVLMIANEPHLKPLLDIPRMAQKAREMLRKSIRAFLDRDAEEARRICREDDEVDQLYDQVFRELLIFMLEDPRTISRATRLLWAAHNLERIADRVTNICERIVFLATGKMEEIGASKY